MTPLHLAPAVVDMLTEAGLDPTPEVGYAPSLERADIGQTRVIVAPGNIASTVIARKGTREFSPDVTVAVLGACAPDDLDAVSGLLTLCAQIGDLLATNPLGTTLAPVRGRVVAVDHDPLYDAARLRAGVFLGVIAARFIL